MKKLISLFIWLLAFVVSFSLVYFSNKHQGQVFLSSTQTDEYTEKILPIMQSRCIACHTCSTAPCQLNLSNYEGIMRGLSQTVVHQGRLSEILTTRIGIDAHSDQEWQSKFKFHSIVRTEPKAPFNSILLLSVLQRSVHNNKKDKLEPEQSHICPKEPQDLLKMYDKRPEAGMPYGLPSLSMEQIEDLKTWISHGAPGPNLENEVALNGIPDSDRPLLRNWEELFNRKDLKSKLIARYIFEHIFSGQIYFPELKSRFFRMVRSKTSCDQVSEIPTRRPYNPPGTDNFNYCFVRFNTGLMDKHKAVYTLSQEKRSRLEELFWKTNWDTQSLPAYDDANSANPFITFKDIPARSRYQFLLDDSYYFTTTFTKGNVCAGDSAVNSIQEQFFIFFLSPNSDESVNNPEYYRKISGLLKLPASNGSNSSVLKVLSNQFDNLTNQYRKARAEAYMQAKPSGFSLTDIWDGDGFNTNAALTVFRHSDNAHVERGLLGDQSKTIWIADYPLFERLVYNLVAGYDVYGNLRHQLFSRVYMGYIRMDGEENFLWFLPPERRREIQKDWYQGSGLTKAQMLVKHPLHGMELPSQIKFESEGNPENQLVRKIAFEILSEKVRGPQDLINWRDQSPIGPVPNDYSASQFKTISSQQARHAPWVKFFPDFSLVIVKSKDPARSQVFSIIRNKEYKNIAWIFFENARRDRESDVIYAFKGFKGSYPNLFLQVDEENLKDLIENVRKLNTEDDFQKFLSKYGILNDSPIFWETYDWLNKKILEEDPVERGQLDLLRYGRREFE